jgi:hypothetical protein
MPILRSYHAYRVCWQDKIKEITRVTPTFVEDNVSPLPSVSESEMNRNMNLIRDILLAFDADQNWWQFVPSGRASDFFEKEGVSEDEIAYGLRLLMDRSLVIGSYDKLPGTFDVERLSMDGHDFLDLIRDPDVWDKTKKAALATRGFTLDLLYALARAGWGLAESAGDSQLAEFLIQGLDW